MLTVSNDETVQLGGANKPSALRGPDPNGRPAGRRGLDGVLMEDVGDHGCGQSAEPLSTRLLTVQADMQMGVEGTLVGHCPWMDPQRTGRCDRDVGWNREPLQTQARSLEQPERDHTDDVTPWSGDGGRMSSETSVKRRQEGCRDNAFRVHSLFQSHGNRQPNCLNTRGGGNEQSRRAELMPFTHHCSR